LNRQTELKFSPFIKQTGLRSILGMLATWAVLQISSRMHCIGCKREAVTMAAPRVGVSASGTTCCRDFVVHRALIAGQRHHSDVICLQAGH
jgi:hypothetical protein